MEKAKRCAIFGNTYQPKKCEAVQKLFDALSSLGIVPLIDKSFFDYLKDEMHANIPEHQLITDDAFDADIAVSMGGDGTFLTTAMRVGEKQIPYHLIDIAEPGTKYNVYQLLNLLERLSFCP